MELRTLRRDRALSRGHGGARGGARGRSIGVQQGVDDGAVPLRDERADVVDGGATDGVEDGCRCGGLRWWPGRWRRRRRIGLAGRCGGGGGRGRRRLHGLGAEDRGGEEAEFAEGGGEGGGGIGEAVDKILEDLKSAQLGGGEFGVEGGDGVEMGRGGVHSTMRAWNGGSVKRMFGYVREVARAGGRCAWFFCGARGVPFL